MTAWTLVMAWIDAFARGIGAQRAIVILEPDALLWIKTPGESDGTCAHGEDPPAGRWWPSYALGLAHRASPPLR